MWTRRPQGNMSTVLTFAHAEVDNGDPMAAKRRGNGPAPRALRGRGALGVHAGEWRPRSVGVDVERNTPSRPLLFLWRIVAHSSPRTNLYGAPLVKAAPPVEAALGWLLVAVLDVLVWLVVTVKGVLNQLLVAAFGVPV